MTLLSDDCNVANCYACGRRLDSQFDYLPEYDYSCSSCGNDTCDADTQMCQEYDDCDVITCFGCVDTHLREYHRIQEVGS